MCLDNGLVPNRRQATIWTNADTIHWRIYAALEGDELKNVPNVPSWQRTQLPQWAVQPAYCGVSNAPDNMYREIIWYVNIMSERWLCGNIFKVVLGHNISFYSNKYVDYWCQQ